MDQDVNILGHLGHVSLRFDLARHSYGPLSQMCTTPVRSLFELFSIFTRHLYDLCTTFVRPLYDPCTSLVRKSSSCGLHATLMRGPCEAHATLTRRSHDRASLRPRQSEESKITHQLLHLRPRTSERVHDASGPIAPPVRFFQDLDEIDMRLGCA